jgi:hypothetical protein
MSRTFKIICTVMLVAPACDEAEVLAGERDAREADERAAELDPEDAVDDEIVADEHVEALGSCATLFENINFGGDRREVDDGAFVPWIGGPWNDQVSSIRVRSGCDLNAYENIDFGGAHKTFAGVVPWVGDTWNDIISSYTCRC